MKQSLLEGLSKLMAAVLACIEFTHFLIKAYFLAFLGLEIASLLTNVSVMENIESSKMIARMSNFQALKSQNMYKEK